MSALKFRTVVTAGDPSEADNTPPNTTHVTRYSSNTSESLLIMASWYAACKDLAAKRGCHVEETLPRLDDRARRDWAVSKAAFAYLVAQQELDAAHAELIEALGKRDK